jgi:cytosine/adenosine deaminase-related metal-dependent hydrolase
MNSGTTIAHGVWVTDREIDAIARTGATVVHNPGCNLRLRNGIAPLARYLARGVRVAIGTDNASLADDEDLLKELRLAAMLARSPSWQADPPPSSADFLAMSTINGAIAAQIAPNVGTLEPKNKADLIAIDLNRVRMPYLDPDTSLTEALLARSTGLDVRLTMVDGYIVYRNGEFPTLDRDILEREAAAAAKAARMPSVPENRYRARDLRKHLAAHYHSITRSE